MNNGVTSVVNLFDIFITFFKISSVTFGGGMAMLPILQREIVNKKLWVTDEEVIDFYAISQGLPGIIAVNIASLIGYKKRGTFGAIFAGLGIISPCLIIIIFISLFLNDFLGIKQVQYAFKGISVAVAALIFSSVISLWKKSILDKFSFILFLISLVLMLATSISPFILVISSCLVSILYKRIEEKK